MLTYISVFLVWKIHAGINGEAFSWYSKPLEQQKMNVLTELRLCHAKDCFLRWFWHQLEKSLQKQMKIWRSFCWPNMSLLKESNWFLFCVMDEIWATWSKLFCRGCHCDAETACVAYVLPLTPPVPTANIKQPAPSCEPGISLRPLRSSLILAATWREAWVHTRGNRCPFSES